MVIKDFHLIWHLVRNAVKRACWVVGEKEVMLNLNWLEWVSFDCYGTLVDWETGISGAWGEGALGELPKSYGTSTSLARPFVSHLLDPI